jgi:uncharacterized damage-inducible protein DinB
MEAFEDLDPCGGRNSSLPPLTGGHPLRLHLHGILGNRYSCPTDGGDPMSMANALLVDAFGRVKGAVHEVVEGLSTEQLTYRVDPDANTIAWLVWHLTRIQDDHVAALAGTEQVWLGDGWVDRFGLPFSRKAHGYGHRSEDVAAVDVPADLLAGYHDAVHERTVTYVEGLAEEDYAEVVDRSWDPPVTRAVRLVSVVGDDLQHVGQAAFLRGVVERSSR